MLEPRTADKLVTAAVAEVLALLLELEIDPRSFKVEGSMVADPVVTVELRSKADLETLAAAEKAKVEHRGPADGLEYHEFSARYNRPGRRMLARARVFPYQPGWPSADAVRIQVG